VFGFGVRLLVRRALDRLEAFRVAAFLYLEPLVTLVAAILILGETLTPAAVAGGLALLAGVALVQKAPETPPVPKS
jgi:drug/metabolite transporter (DMT)-like permease